MTAETVFIVAKSLSNDQMERLKEMLNNEQKIAKNNKKSKIWNETEVTEKLILLFEKRKKNNSL
ncbi:MAG: hypothetical protein Q4A09_06370 [Capnocytophaga felis]|nr:hypothetical protein [Capnocytophaga felis]